MSRILSSLRVRLVLLVLVAAVPGMGLLFHEGVEQWQLERRIKAPGLEPCAGDQQRVRATGSGRSLSLASPGWADINSLAQQQAMQRYPFQIGESSPGIHEPWGGYAQWRGILQ